MEIIIILRASLKGGKTVQTARGLTAEATRSSSMYDEASVSGTEPTTAGLICTQEDQWEGDALGETIPVIVYASLSLLKARLCSHLLAVRSNKVMGVETLWRDILGISILLPARWKLDM